MKNIWTIYIGAGHILQGWIMIVSLGFMRPPLALLASTQYARWDMRRRDKRHAKFRATRKNDPNCSFPFCDCEETCD